MPRDIEEIVIRFIPLDEMRYATVGDWRFENSRLVIEVAQMDPLYEHAVALHELVEALLCNHAGVTQEAVDAFDMGPGKDLEEPGFSTDAPYHVQHCWADVVERTFIAAAGESWSEYDKAVGDHGCEC